MTREDAHHIVKHEWLQVFVMAITVAGIFLWARTESKSDYRELRGCVEAIHVEMKDFHGRLCAIEERNRK